MQALGNSLPEALENMDNLHSRLAMSYKSLKAPSFWCTQKTDSSLVLYYFSKRQGLTSMVQGLVQGLAKRFELKARVSLLSTEESQALAEPGIPQTAYAFQVDYVPSLSQQR